MDPSNKNLLADLKDIHYPDPVSWWPLAPGWYLALILGILIITALGIFSIKYYRRYKLKKAVLLELNAIRQEKNIGSLSILLRRVAISFYPRAQVASLKGNAWLSFLDREGKTNQFTNGVGKLLLSAPYRRNNPKQYQELFDLVEKWIRKKL